MLSVIIVTWNGLRYLPDCVEALVPQLPSGSEIVLVDNGSTDGTGAWAHAQGSPLRLLSMPVNLGFAGGVNAGIRAARGDLLLLLNNDAFVEPGCVPALLEALEQSPQAGAAGGVLLFAHRPEIIASAGICIQRDGLAIDRWTGRQVHEVPSKPQSIFGASGGLVLLRQRMLADIGLLEPSFFAYLEDADLAWRAQLRGWETIGVPKARARHIYSATGGQGSAFKQRLLARNRLRTIIRCWPNSLLWQHSLAIGGYDMMASAYGLLSRQPAIIRGRLEVFGELDTLLLQRKAIQSRRIVTEAQLARWLHPAVSPRRALAQQRHLDALLQARDSLLPDLTALAN